MKVSSSEPSHSARISTTWVFKLVRMKRVENFYHHACQKTGRVSIPCTLQAHLKMTTIAPSTQCNLLLLKFALARTVEVAAVSHLLKLDFVQSRLKISNPVEMKMMLNMKTKGKMCSLLRLAPLVMSSQEFRA